VPLVEVTLVHGGDLLGGGRKGGSSLPGRATLGLGQPADLSRVGPELGIAREPGRKPDLLWEEGASRLSKRVSHRADLLDLA